MSKYRRFNLDNDEIGELTERMLIAAATHHRARFLVKIERSPVHWDMRGVDAIAKVKYPNGDIVWVPIQVKSEKKWLEKFYKEKSNLVEAGIVAFVISPKDNMVDICLKLYSGLDGTIKANRRFDQLLPMLNAEVVGRGIEGCRNIERSRQLNPKNPHTPNDFSFWRWLYLKFVY